MCFTQVVASTSFFPFFDCKKDADPRTPPPVPHSLFSTSVHRRCLNDDDETIEVIT